MSFHKAELAKLQAMGGAAWRKYQRLMAEAQGAQHGSPAEAAKIHFEHAWVQDCDAVKAAAEKEEDHGRKSPKR